MEGLKALSRVGGVSKTDQTSSHVDLSAVGLEEVHADDEANRVASRLHHVEGDLVLDGAEEDVQGDLQGSAEGASTSVTESLVCSDRSAVLLRRQVVFVAHADASLRVDPDSLGLAVDFGGDAKDGNSSRRGRELDVGDQHWTHRTLRRLGLVLGLVLVKRFALVVVLGLLVLLVRVDAGDVALAGLHFVLELLVELVRWVARLRALRAGVTHFTAVKAVNVTLRSTFTLKAFSVDSSDLTRRKSVGEGHGEVDSLVQSQVWSSRHVLVDQRPKRSLKSSDEPNTLFSLAAGGVAERTKLEEFTVVRGHGEAVLPESVVLSDLAGDFGRSVKLPQHPCSSCRPVG